MLTPRPSGNSGLTACMSVSVISPGFHGEAARRSSSSCALCRAEAELSGGVVGEVTGRASSFMQTGLFFLPVLQNKQKAGEKQAGGVGLCYLCYRDGERALPAPAELKCRVRSVRSEENRWLVVSCNLLLSHLCKRGVSFAFSGTCSEVQLLLLLFF